MKNANLIRILALTGDSFGAGFVCQQQLAEFKIFQQAGCRSSFILFLDGNRQPRTSNPKAVDKKLLSESAHFQNKNQIQVGTTLAGDITPLQVVTGDSGIKTKLTV